MFIDFHKADVLMNLMKLMLCGVLKEKPEFDTSVIYQNIDKIGLTYLNREYVIDLLDEYRSSGKLELWDNENITELSRKITDVLGIRNRIENTVLNANDFSELSSELSNIASEVIPNSSVDIKAALTECLMKDMSMQADERNIREGIYNEWHRRMADEAVII